ncbi:MAG: alkaline phosphatase family protein, partial [Gaiellaceae bacterium]
MSTYSRKSFLALSAGAVLTQAPLARAATQFLEHADAALLPRPGRSGIEHVVVVMMENRSFDHLLGWLPHADGKQAGLKY